MIWNGVWPVHNYDHLSLCPSSTSHPITSHHIISLLVSQSFSGPQIHKSKLKMVKAACLLVMTWMMMGSDLTDLFATAHLMSHITNDARVHSCIMLWLCTDATLKVGVYLCGWVYGVFSFVCGTDIIWCRLVIVLRLQSQRLIDKWIWFANVIKLIGNTAMGCWEQI